MTDARTVIIADDHPLFRKGLVDALRSDGTFSVIGEATDGETALRLIEKHRPRYAILDVDMPKASGLDVAAAVQQASLPVDVVVLTMHEEATVLHRALELGVKGYVLKDSAVTDIVACLNLVSAGKRYVSPAMSSHLVERHERRQQEGDQPGLGDLSPAERKVLKLVADQHTTRAIAKSLAISPKTVEHHRAHICAKLGLHGPNALLAYAIQHRAEL